MERESYETMKARLENGQFLRWITAESSGIRIIKEIKTVGEFETPDGPVYTDVMGLVINSNQWVTYCETADED